MFSGLCTAFDDPEPKHGGTGRAGSGGAHGATDVLESVGGDEDPRGKHRALDKKKAKAAKAPPKGPPLAKPGATAPKKAGPKGVGKSASAPAKAKPSASSSSSSAKAPVPLPPPPKPPPPSAVEVAPAISSLEDAPRRRAPRRQKEELYINAVGPGTVFWDEYHPPDGRPPYGNWNMKCPHCPKAVKCERTQGEIPRNFTLGLGPLEVIAFLHAWRDVEIDPARGHRKTNPTPEQIRTFHDNHRAELKALKDQFVTTDSP